MSLHITITSSPRPAVDAERRRVSVHHDLQLLKAGLLYADRVTLCSMPAAMMAACLQAEASSAQDRARFLEEVAPTLPADKAGLLRQAAAMLREFSRPRKGRYRSQQEILRERRFFLQMDQLWPQAIADANALLEGSGADGLRDALSTGVVDLHAFSSIENAVPELVEYLRRVVSSGSTYPLFDDEVANLVSSGVAVGVLEPSRQDAGRAKHAALAASLLQRLPTFDLATIGEVVQVRRELARPLVGFRGAVLAFSTQIEAAVWDGNFAKDADATFVQKVAPAIQALEDEIQQNTFVRNLRERAVQPTSPLLIGSFGAALTKLADLSEIVQVGLGATVATAIVQAWNDTLKARQKAEQNQLFFYYRAGRMLRR